jgi:hypothetical protein
MKKVVYFALIFSTFIYGIVVWFLFANKEPSGTLQQELHRTDVLALLFMALAALIVSLRFPADITRWAIVESVCIWGLVATFLTHDWRLFAGGWALSLIGYALAFPSPEEQTTAR